MPKKLRRRIFYALIAVFLILGTGAVLYAQGWRLELQDGKGLAFSKVGAIYVRSFPAEAAIYLDGETQEKGGGLFDRGTLITDLAPGDYELRIDRDGFQPWQSQATVTSSLVTSLRYVVLVPTGASTATSTPVEDIDPAGRTLVLYTDDGMTTLSGIPVAGSRLLAGSLDGTILLTYATSTRNYFSVDLSRATSTVLGQLGQLSFQPVPGDNGLFLAQRPASIGLLNVREARINPLATATASVTATAPGRAAWAEFDPDTNMSILSFYDLAARQLDAEADSLPGRVTQMILRDDNTLLALSEDGSLYLVDTGQSSRARLARGMRLAVLANDGNSLAALGEKGIEVFFLRGERLGLSFEVPEPDRVESLAWYQDNEHIFVTYPDRTAFLDLADARLSNFHTAAPSGVSVYDPERNTLYFVQEGLLHTVVFPG